MLAGARALDAGGRFNLPRTKASRGSSIATPIVTHTAIRGSAGYRLVVSICITSHASATAKTTRTTPSDRTTRWALPSIPHTTAARSPNCAAACSTAPIAAPKGTRTCAQSGSVINRDISACPRYRSNGVALTTNR